MAGVLTITTTHHVPIGTSGLDEFLSAHDNVTVVCQPLPAVLRDCKDIETAPLPAAGPDAHEVPARVLFLLAACCATATDDLLSSTVPAFLAAPSRAFIQRVLIALITGGLTIPPDSKLALLLDRASSLAATLTQQGDTSFLCAPTDLARLRARGDPHIIGHMPVPPLPYDGFYAGICAAPFAAFADASGTLTTWGLIHWVAQPCITQQSREDRRASPGADVAKSADRSLLSSVSRRAKHVGERLERDFAVRQMLLPRARMLHVKGGERSDAVLDEGPRVRQRGNLVELGVHVLCRARTHVGGVQRARLRPIEEGHLLLYSCG